MEEPERLRRQLKRARIKARHLDTSPQNRRDILTFADNCFSEGLSIRRVVKYLGMLGKLSKLFRRDFREATRSDVEYVVRRIERSDYKEWTKHDYRVVLRIFFRWLRQSDTYPPEVGWIRTTMKKCKAILPNEILTQKEVGNLIAAARNTRDKALISVLYESGCRVGELLGIRMRNLQPHKHGFQISVKGGKGSRRLLLIASASYMSAWLNDHPRAEVADAPLWIGSTYKAKAVGYAQVRKLLRQAAKRAGIRKAVNPHNFRHSRATHLASHLTEAQMKEYFGWGQDSGMAATYVHLSGRDIDNALLKLQGIETGDEDDETSGFTEQVCPRCGTANGPADRFCSTCGQILDEETARQIVQQEAQRSQADDIMDTLIDDPEVREVLQRKISRLVAGGKPAGR